MLKLIRKKGVIKTLIWIIAILIIISFGFMGTAYLVNDLNQKKYAGEIFGQKIPREEFEKHFRNVNINSLIQYGDKFYDVRQYLNLGGQTWDRLILLHEADKQNIQVTDKDIVDTIAKYPFFLKDNRFDRNLYERILTNVFKVSARDFEEGLRDSLRISRMFDDLSRDITISDDDLFEAFKKRQEKIQVSYITLTPADFKDKISVSDSEITDFYNEKKLDFIQPESINVEYIRMDFPENATDDDKAAARQKADELLAALSGGSAEDILKTRQLALQTTGFFSKENPKTDLGWPLESMNTIFELTPDEWFGPFENNTSLFLARLKERRDAYLPELPEIKAKVKDAVLKEKGLAMAKDQMTDHLKILQDKAAATNAPDFNAWSKDFGLETVQTPMFTRGQYLPKIGISPDFQEAAFKLSDDDMISGVVHTDQGSFILFFDGYTPADRDEFMKVKDQIEKEFLAMKKNELFSALLSKLRAQSNFKDYLEAEK